MMRKMSSSGLVRVGAAGARHGSALEKRIAPGRRARPLLHKIALGRAHKLSWKRRGHRCVPTIVPLPWVQANPRPAAGVAQRRRRPVGGEAERRLEICRGQVFLKNKGPAFPFIALL